MTVPSATSRPKGHVTGNDAADRLLDRMHNEEGIGLDSIGPTRVQYATRKRQRGRRSFPMPPWPHLVRLRGVSTVPSGTLERVTRPTEDSSAGSRNSARGWRHEQDGGDT